MTPLRKYNKATIWFRDVDRHQQPDGEYFEVCVYSSIVIYFDERGKEHTIPMVFVKEIIEYAEDRLVQKEVVKGTVQVVNPIPPGDPVSGITMTPVPETRKIQSPRKGIAYHV